nr:unnamed protein product [Spirometra erinaceieuropaei]
MSRAEEYIPTPIAQCPTQPSDLNKKQMPRIINYLSDDDDEDDDDEDSKPLAELRLEFAQFPALDYSPLQLPGIDACDSPSSDEEDPALADYLKYPSLLNTTIPHAFSSKEFHRLVKKQSPTYSEKLRIPNSYVVFFHEILSSGQLPTQGLPFASLSKMITDRWNQLPPRERLMYKEKALNTKQSYSRHLTAYRTKLLALNSRERPICRHSPCSKPVIADRRWNLQYCSADCLLAHCQVTFSRRYRRLEEGDPTRVPLPASDAANEVTAPAIDPHFTLRDCSVELRQSDYQSATDQRASTSSSASSTAGGGTPAASSPTVTDPAASFPSTVYTTSIPPDNLFERFRWKACPAATQPNTIQIFEKTNIAASFELMSLPGRGFVSLRSCADSRVLRLSRRLVHDVSEKANEKKYLGLVGAFVCGKPHGGHLSPALEFVDEVFVKNALKERISKTFYPKNAGCVDTFPATFLQNNYRLVYAGLNLRSSSCKVNDGNTDTQEHIVWPKLSFGSLRSCIGKGVQLLQRQGISEIFVDPLTNAEAVSEAAHLAAFRFDELKNHCKQLPKPTISCFTAHLDNDPDGFSAKEQLLASWNRGRILAQSQNLARRWMEMPANLMSPKTFAYSIQETLGKIPSNGDTTTRVTVYDHDWCEQNKMGGILGVAAGSSRKPVFVEIEYIGDPSRPREHIALVGKGVVFDAGGISIKPSLGMGDMRADMGGAAVVAAVVFGLAQLKSPINVRAYLPLVENMPDGAATRPGDVIKMANGMTVQVDNTDAEGRLILADALHYAQHNPSAAAEPALLIDVATLTGAISVALGDQYTGLFCNTPVMRKNLSEVWPPSQQQSQSSTDYLNLPRSLIGCLNQCGRLHSDPFWHLPSLYFRQLQDNCHLADLSNITTGAHAKLGGSGSAASFLQHFINHRIPHIHLDIAGVMKFLTDEPWARRGMSGRPTRPLIHFLDYMARAPQDVPAPTELYEDVTGQTSS